MAGNGEEFRVGVLASGNGSTFEAVVDAAGTDQLPDTEISFVVCNNSAANPNAGVWERAERLGVPIHHVSNKTQRECTLPEKDGEVVPGTISYEASEALTRLADEYGVHILVGLGYKKRLIGKVLAEVSIANGHPGPLGPDLLTARLHGDAVQEEVMRRRLPYSGPTFHWMDTRLDESGLPAYDTGPEIGHYPVKVTDAMRQEWKTTGGVVLLKAEVMEKEKLWVPRWIRTALEQIYE